MDLTPRKCVTKKKCFASEAEAEPYLQFGRETDHPSVAKLLGVYRCNQCHWLHIGHDRGWKALRTTRRGKNKRVPHQTFVGRSVYGHSM